MKTIRLVLALCIVTGLLLLVTQSYWAPRLVEAIISWQTDVVAIVPIVEIVAQNATTSETTMETWNWVYATTSVRGIQYMYPNPMPTTYVSPVDWPPQVIVSTGTVSCNEGDMASHSGEITTSKQRVISKQIYCVSEAKQGAAGTVYTQYQYATQQGDFVASVSFTLKTSQCMNYDVPTQHECLLEQSEFSVDVLAQRILESITTQ